MNIVLHIIKYATHHSWIFVTCILFLAFSFKLLALSSAKRLIMNSPLISIIVPVYQVEKYLEKCINSIIAQSYKNLEIILVDDGSTDNCPAICDRFQSEDSRIKVIHQQNGGLSHARNVGLEHATGDFIGFVDSDDWIEQNMYEVLMSALQETGADIAVCDRQMESKDSQPFQINICPSRIKCYSTESALRLIISGSNIIRNSVWNKLYKKKVLSNIKFPLKRIYEDIQWTSQIIGNANFLVYVNYRFYHYLQRSESLSHDSSLTIQRLLDKVEMFEQRKKYIQEYHPNLTNLAILKLQNFCCGEYINICINGNQLDKDGRIRYKLHRKFCQLRPFYILNYDGFCTTFGRILFRLFPNLLVKLFIIYNKLH